jgi:hypothetical protein
MGQKIKLDDNEYDIEKLSNQAKATLDSLQFANLRLKELKNMSALLQRAKNSYLSSLKKEILSNKSGVFFEDE